MTQSLSQESHQIETFARESTLKHLATKDARERSLRLDQFTREMVGMGYMECRRAPGKAPPEGFDDTLIREVTGEGREPQTVVPTAYGRTDGAVVAGLDPHSGTWTLETGPDESFGRHIWDPALEKWLTHLFLDFPESSRLSEAEALALLPKVPSVSAFYARRSSR